MTEQEELEELRYLAELHCKWCTDCEWEKIPETGLLEKTEYELHQDGEMTVHPHNEDCPFANYWDRRATDDVWRGAPCHGCKGCVSGAQADCEKYQKWVEGLEPWERKRAAEHWTQTVNRAYPEWECGYTGWIEKGLKGCSQKEK